MWRHAESMQLRCLEERLDRLLSLGPLMPRTSAQKLAWDPPEPLPFPIPTVAQWERPYWIPQFQANGLFLSNTAVCFQRGYMNESLYREYTEIAAEAFQCSPESIRNSLNQFSFDFVVLVLDCTHDKVKAGCVVEFRPSPTPEDPPYLYISTVAVRNALRHKKLGHQLLHAVHTLGMLMVKQNDQWSGWRGALPKETLFLALNVRVTEEKAAYQKLISFYSDCGFVLNNRIQGKRYKSFTPYSPYPWQIDQSAELIPMFKDLSPNIIYADQRVKIIDPRYTSGYTMYHWLPHSHLQSVQKNGIFITAHLDQDELQTGAYYTQNSIVFTHTKPPAATHCYFCIRTVQQHVDEDIVIHISIPYWFAVRIGPVRSPNP